MKYSSIGEWLKKQLGPVCTITFSGLEKGADIELPDSAYRYRQWWENDDVSRPTIARVALGRVESGERRSQSATRCLRSCRLRGCRVGGTMAECRCVWSEPSENPRPRTASVSGDPFPAARPAWWES
jgi:hypothetical protein